jgi:tetratricopeptide (TPR) repeat protein
MKRKSTLALALIGLFVFAQAGLQRGVIYERWKQDFAPKTSLTAGTGLAPDQLLFALAGFREMVAGILWVRADSFFETGNYDAILPIIRLVTILDPKQLDVYATGMWHIGYNFTDEEQRSDRRYIPSALALGKEGIRNNPETYEMFFETGWMWYHKIDDDYHQAVKYFQEAQERRDIQPARRNLLGMAFQRDGQIQKALDHYYQLYEEADRKFKRDPMYQNRQNRDTIENNLDTMLVRMVQRGWIAQQEGRIDQGKYDTNPPFDVGFSAKVSVVDLRVLRIQGTWNVRPIGTRIRVVLRDAEYPNARLAAMDWDGNNDVNLDPPTDRTFMQDQLYVRDQAFNKKFDMSKDPTMYPFTSEKYVIEFFYSPRSAPPHIQDKFGWNGEGMTDANFLRTDVRPGQRVMYTSLELTKDQLLRRGEWQDRVPIVMTKNFKERGNVADQDELIMVPALRGGQ